MNRGETMERGESVVERLGSGETVECGETVYWRDCVLERLCSGETVECGETVYWRDCVLARLCSGETVECGETVYWRAGSVKESTWRKCNVTPLMFIPPFPAFPDWNNPKLFHYTPPGFDPAPHS